MGQLQPSHRTLHKTFGSPPHSGLEPGLSEAAALGMKKQQEMSLLPGEREDLKSRLQNSKMQVLFERETLPTIYRGGGFKAVRTKAPASQPAHCIAPTPTSAEREQLSPLEQDFKAPCRTCELSGQQLIPSKGGAAPLGGGGLASGKS